MDCPTCGKPGYSGQCPPEPPIGTWIKDRYGATSVRQSNAYGEGWGKPGFMPFGKWEAMWEARGPLEICGPYGIPLGRENDNDQRSSSVTRSS